jgi:hypothetical protein
MVSTLLPPFDSIRLHSHHTFREAWVARGVPSAGTAISLSARRERQKSARLGNGTPGK